MIVLLVSSIIIYLSSVNIYSFEVSAPASTKLGYRFQSVARQKSITSRTGDKSQEQDFYLRRARLELAVDWGDGLTQSLDIRNDNINYENKGMGVFRLGDAYFSKVIKANKFEHDFRFFKAKVDVSRSQTVSSARLIYINRAHSSDFASDYISQNRRANNIQWNGQYNEKVEWQIAFGEGSNANKFKDGLGNNLDSISEKRWVYGLKTRFYLWGKRQNKVDETFFKDDDLLSLGVGVFHQPTISLKKGLFEEQGDRTLTNVEVTLHFGDLSIMGEYFSFSRVYRDFSNGFGEVGRSEAFYIQSEYFLTEKYSTFLRYEKWDRMVSIGSLALENYVAGGNYYYSKNKLKFGLFVDYERNGSGIISNHEETSVLLTSMIHFK